MVWIVTGAVARGDELYKNSISSAPKMALISYLIGYTACLLNNQKQKYKSSG